MTFFSGLNTRSHPSNPDNDLLYMMGGGNLSYTGKTVTDSSAMSVTAIFNAVRLIAEAIGHLPLFLYKRRADGGKDKDYDNPLFNLLHIQPNPMMTAIAFREAIAGNSILQGTCYAEKVENNSGVITELWPLLPNNMAVKVINNKLVYAYQLPDGKTKMFSQDKILRVPGFSAQGLLGYKPVELGQEAIGLALALEEFGAKFFGNGARPSVVLEHPDQLSDKAYTHLKESYEERHQGLSNAHRVAILEEGMKLKDYGASPEQAQAIESRKFQVDEVARLMNIPVHMLKQLDRATYNNTEHLGGEFVTFCLVPWLVRFEQAYSVNLLPKKDLNTLFFEHQLAGLLRGSTKDRHEAYMSGKQWGYLSTNDIRSFENLNPVDGGDDYWQPVNMGIMGEPPPGTEPPPDNDGPPKPPDENLLQFLNNEHRNDDAPCPCGCDEGIETRALKPIPKGRARAMKTFERLYRSVIGKLVDYEVRQIRGAVKNTLNRSVSDFSKWLDSFETTLTGKVDRDAGPALTAYAESVRDAAIDEIGEDPDDDDFRNFIDSYVPGYATAYAGASVGQMRQIVAETDPQDLADTVNERLDEWEEKKVDKEVDRQKYSVSNGAAAATFGAAAVGTVWANRGKSCKFCMSLEGKRVSRGQPFINDSSKFQPEGTAMPLGGRSKTFYPPIHRGCFPGDTKVTYGELKASSKRWFDGNLIVIDTASGKNLSPTPNHPILTSRGWVVAGELKEGDYVISRSLCDGDVCVISDDHNVVSSIHDVSESFGRSPDVLTIPVPTSTKDFHGDVIDSEIAIISSNSSLLSEGDALIAEKLSKFCFKRGNSGSCMFPSLCKFNSGCFTMNASGCSLVCGGSLPLSLLFSHFATPDESSRTMASSLNTTFSKDSLNDWPRDAESLGNENFGFTGEIFIDEITRINMSKFSGHVYNLQTNNGIYTANGIFSHNCDCIVVPG